MGHGGEKIRLEAVGALRLLEQPGIFQGHGGDLRDPLGNAPLPQRKALWPAPMASSLYADDCLAPPQDQVETGGHAELFCQGRRQ